MSASALDDVFSPTGRLFERLPGFTYRSSQQQMAELVQQALEHGQHAALEAGTGIGKTYAYLIPVLLSGRRAIISTGTKTLQDQLYARDLPALGGVIGRPVDVALLKGRANYLCRHRLLTALHDAASPAALRERVAALVEWGESDSSGDLTRLEDLADDHVLKGLVTSTVDNCLGGHCEHIERCFVVEARRAAQRADVVVVNHHLLLADLALKEAGFGDLLPGADVVVVDEAHQFPDVAQQFFGVAVTGRELELIVRDCGAEARVAGVADAVDAAARDLSRLIADAQIGSRDLAGDVPWHAGPARWRETLTDIAPALTALAADIVNIDAAGAGLSRCRERCEDAAARLTSILDADDGDGLRWLKFSARNFGVHLTPFDTGAALAERIADQQGVWIFTSATLAVGDDFSHFLGRIGLDAALTCALPSPFDYRRNARLYVPEGLPAPGAGEHTAALMDAAWPLIEAAGGGAFLLFTSYRALNAAEQWIGLRRPPGPVLVQGHGSRSQLLEQFRAAGSAILLGTGSFWQGVDVRGPALRVVVIDKLPFAAPSDPLVQARVAAIRRDGGDPFTAFQLPQAVLALKQGVGRLVRDFDDRGLVVLGDPRLRTRGYGRVFLDSLPPMPLLDGADEALEFAAGLAPAASADALP
jgi:ATP-dependent DNA helicase DinG